MKQQSRTIESDCFGLPNNAGKINSKNKGNYNERNCAKALELWTGLHFVRVPASGGLRWKDSTNVTGDLICDTPDNTFPFTIETKHLRNITIRRTLSNSAAIFKIWQQVASDALRAHKLPMALLRSNGMNVGEYYVVFDAGMGGAIMSLSVPITFSGSNHTYSLVGFLLSDVKKHMPYTTFAKAVKRQNFLANSKFFNQE